MPQALPAIIATVGAGIAGVTGLKLLGVFVLNLALTGLNMLLMKRERDVGPPPTNVSIRSTIEWKRYVLGTRRVGGSFVFIRTSNGALGAGEPNKYLWYVIAYADHQCSDVRDRWIDQRKVADADINPSTGVVTGWNDKLRIWNRLGTGAQSAPTELTSVFASGPVQWTTNDRLRGVCFDIYRYERDPDQFPGGAPQHCSALVDGALTYDSRLDSTNGGSGSHRRDDPQTWSFSRNWARNVRWWLTGGSVVNDQATRVVKYGLREVDARIADTTFAAAANVSDETLSGGNAPPGGAESRYLLDIDISAGQLRRDVLTELLAAGGPGTLVPIKGKLRLYAGAYDAPVHSFTQDDLRGDLEIDDTSEEGERFNHVSATYVNAAKEWTEATTLYRTNSAYVTQDDGQELFREIALRGVTSNYQAQRIVERALRASRQMRGPTFRFGRKGLAVAPHETLNYSDNTFATPWVNRVFRCVERQVEVDEDGAIITIIRSKAESSTVSTDLLTADYQTGTSVASAIQQETPDTPLTFTATSVPLAIEFAWTLGTFWQLHGVIELWEATPGGNFASATKIQEIRGSGYRLQKTDHTARPYWIRLRTIGGQVSAELALSGSTARAGPPSGQGWAVDSQGKPRGIRGVEGIADRSHLQFGGIGIQLLSTTDDSVGYGFPAIPIDDTATYLLTIRHKSSAADSDGLYLRFSELNAALAAGKTHVGDNTGVEAVVQTRSSLVDLVANGAMPGTTVVENTYTYTPTSGTKFATFSMLNWTGFSGTYEVEWVRLSKTGTNVNLLTQGADTTEDITPNAATQTHETNNSAPGAISTSHPYITSVNSQRLYATFTPPVDCDILVRCTFKAQVTGGAGGFTARAYAFRALSAGTSQTLGAQLMSLTTTQEGYAVQGKFAVVGGTAYRAGLYIELTTSSNNGTLTPTDCHVIVEEIRR